MNAASTTNIDGDIRADATDEIMLLSRVVVVLTDVSLGFDSVASRGSVAADCGLLKDACADEMLRENAEGYHRCPYPQSRAKGRGKS